MALQLKKDSKSVSVLPRKLYAQTKLDKAQRLIELYLFDSLSPLCISGVTIEPVPYKNKYKLPDVSPNIEEIEQVIKKKVALKHVDKVNLETITYKEGELNRIILHLKDNTKASFLLPVLDTMNKERRDVLLSKVNKHTKLIRYRD